MREIKDAFISFICVVLVIAAVVFFVGGLPVKTREEVPESTTAEVTNVTSGDQICYSSAPEQEHLRKEKEIGLTYADNEMIVQLAGSLSKEEAAQLARQNGAELVGFINISGTCQWRFSKGESLEELEKRSNELKKQSEIDYAFINTIQMDSENDYNPAGGQKQEDIINECSSFNHNAEAHWGFLDINANAVYDAIDKMKTPVNVGIYDSTFVNDSDELDHLIYLCDTYSLKEARKSKNSSHGTHVAGIAVAKYGNKKGIAGVYPCPGNSKVYAGTWRNALYDPTTEKKDNDNKVKTYKSQMDILRDYAWFFYHNVRVINCSYGVGKEAVKAILKEHENGGGKIQTQEYFGLKMPAECYTIFFDRFIDAGYQFLIVASAGNEAEKGAYVDTKYASVNNYISKKSIADRIIVVGAYNRKHQVPEFCNRGSRLDIMAPGVKIYSTIGEGKNGYMQGTSMAAPYVTGTIASIWALDDSRSAAEVRSILLREGSGLSDEDYIWDNQKKGTGQKVLKLDVKKSMDLALGSQSESEKERSETAADDEKDYSEIVRIRVFLQNEDSFKETKAANVTVIGEDGTVYYDRERIAYPAEESVSGDDRKFKYYGQNSAFYLPLPKGRYEVIVEADGIEEKLAIQGLDPEQDYFGEEGLRKLIHQFIGENLEDIPQWELVIKTESEEIRQTELLVSDEERLKEFISRQNYYFIPTGNISSVPSSAWTDAEDPGWTKDDITGVLSLDIADYDYDQKDELLVLSLDTESETWYDSPIQTTYLTMQMYEVSGSKVECAAQEKIAVSKSFFTTLLVSDQLNCFVFENAGMQYIVLDSHQWAEESAQVTNVYCYDGQQFVYKNGTAFLIMGEGNLYCWSATERSEWLNVTQAAEILNSQGRWYLQDYYRAEEHDWKMFDEYTLSKIAGEYFASVRMTNEDARIFDTQNETDFAARYNRIHSLTAKDTYQNRGLNNYRRLGTVFTRHQLNQTPAWTLIREDESLANEYR